MRRREFITLLGGAATWPLMALAQQARLPRIGALHSAARDRTTHFMAAYLEGLKSEGYTDGVNVNIEYRWANGVIDVIPAMMAELVRLKPDVIMAFGTATRAAYESRMSGAAGNIPFVFAFGVDPVTAGFVSNINRPDNNITGASSFGLNLAPKRVELLHEFIRSGSKLGFLINPSIDPAQNTIEVRDIEAAGHVFGWQLLLYKAATVAEFQPAFEAMVRDRIDALIIATDTFFYSEIGLLGSLAERYALPAIGPLRDFPAAGGLMSYSSSIPNTYRQAGIYTGKVLNGAKPSDLPFLFPTRFELVINVKAANALHLSVPLTLQMAADEVIE